MDAAHIEASSLVDNPSSEPLRTASMPSPSPSPSPLHSSDALTSSPAPPPSKYVVPHVPGPVYMASPLPSPRPNTTPPPISWTESEAIAPPSACYTAPPFAASMAPHLSSSMAPPLTSSMAPPMNSFMDSPLNSSTDPLLTSSMDPPISSMATPLTSPRSESTVAPLNVVAANYRYLKPSDPGMYTYLQTPAITNVQTTTRTFPSRAPFLYDGYVPSVLDAQISQSYFRTFLDRPRPRSHQFPSLDHKDEKENRPMNGPAPAIKKHLFGRPGALFKPIANRKENAKSKTTSRNVSLLVQLLPAGWTSSPGTNSPVRQRSPLPR